VNCFFYPFCPYWGHNCKTYALTVHTYDNRSFLDLSFATVEQPIKHNGCKTLAIPFRFYYFMNYLPEMLIRQLRSL